MKRLLTTVAAGILITGAAHAHSDDTHDALVCCENPPHGRVRGPCKYSSVFAYAPHDRVCVGCRTIPEGTVAFEYKGPNNALTEPPKAPAQLKGNGARPVNGKAPARRLPRHRRLAHCSRIALPARSKFASSSRAAMAGTAITDHRSMVRRKSRCDSRSDAAQPGHGMTPVTPSMTGQMRSSSYRRSNCTALTTALLASIWRFNLSRARRDLRDERSFGKIGSH